MSCATGTPGTPGLYRTCKTWWTTPTQLRLPLKEVGLQLVFACTNDATMLRLVLVLGYMQYWSDTGTDLGPETYIWASARVLAFTTSLPLQFRGLQQLSELFSFARAFMENHSCICTPASLIPSCLQHEKPARYFSYKENYRVETVSNAN